MKIKFSVGQTKWDVLSFARSGIEYFRRFPFDGMRIRFSTFEEMLRTEVPDFARENCPKPREDRVDTLSRKVVCRLGTPFIPWIHQSGNFRLLGNDRLSEKSGQRNEHAVVDDPQVK